MQGKKGVVVESLVERFGANKTKRRSEVKLDQTLPCTKQAQSGSGGHASRRYGVLSRSFGSVRCRHCCPAWHV
jgi:hypothetical protein